MLPAFITIRVLDILDILLVAYLMFQIYMLIRGSVAMNIFIGILFVYFLWIIVKALRMQLLGIILGQVIGRCNCTDHCLPARNTKIPNFYW